MILNNMLKIPISKGYKNLLNTYGCKYGKISNGISYIFATVDTQDSSTNISFTGSVFSIDESSFNAWKIAITSILGEKIITKIEAEAATIQETLNFCSSQYMSIYSLLVFEYSLHMEFNIKKYINQSEIPFPENYTPLYNQIIDTIYNLNSQTIPFKGTITATEQQPIVAVYIPVTFFEFGTGKVVSFADYRGPVTVLSGSDRVCTLKLIF